MKRNIENPSKVANALLLLSKPMHAVGIPDVTVLVIVMLINIALLVLVPVVSLADVLVSRTHP